MNSTFRDYKWKGGRYDKEFKGSANTANKNFFKSKDAEKK